MHNLQICVLNCFSSMGSRNRILLKHVSILLVFFLSLSCCSTSETLTPSLLNLVVSNTTLLHRNFTALSEFRMINRRILSDCSASNPSLKVNVLSNSTLSDEEFVTVTVTGVSNPSDGDWVAMISPSNSDVKSCVLNELFYLQTGDTAKLPLLCHYPVKAQYMKNDPNYLSCKNKECKKYQDGKCVISTCSGSIQFHVINIRSDIEFVFFSGGFLKPCLVGRSTPVSFANPKRPLYGHLSSIDSTGESMRLTWVSGDKEPQQIQYGNGEAVTSTVTTFSQADMCSSALPSPAKDFGWHDPGYIHSALMTGLKPSSPFSYKYGSDSVGWSNQIQFSTPPAGGSDELRFIAFGDMGKTPLDASKEHYIQPGALSVIKAIAKDVNSNKVNSVFHIGDISYATGFLAEWDFFLHLINPVASRVSYMTAIGNHERDYVDSGSVYITPDSGGECGVPYETYFPMPTSAKDKPWYSIEQGSVHFTVISTEHDWSENSEQYAWMKKDMASVNRQKTPWLIFMGHRPMYTSHPGLFSSENKFNEAVEPLLFQNKVDLALFGHVHNYERTCSVFQHKCKAMPTKDKNGVDTYDGRNYSAPVHVVIGMAGFTLDNFSSNAESWSLKRITEFGYLRSHATTKDLSLEFVVSNTKEVMDSFHITK
ncbi:probable inactive purple acid phosphatase 27 isoform X2 [Vigna unguiculata]|uniref:probable inactive purple acid phosphatase 27 isoform X2 n=1 Tax=Vigna unguiculata TaxID=3917 RepID=UPI0010160015|nr:probable inactive purple acid phosphatase 27 isoform X2 [Vigna unguiculata]